MLELVREIGAAAGFAAALGLAVLSALHLSQARDVKRLREWAARAERAGGAPPSAQAKRNGAPVRPDDVAVAVLNGTTVPGLAAALRDQIAAGGFKKGPIDVFPDQQLAESLVQYAPGYEAEASAVGQRIGISRRAPASADSRALAGEATVIVIAGADKAP